LYINNLEYESEDICDEQIFSTNQFYDLSQWRLNRIFVVYVKIYLKIVMLIETSGAVRTVPDPFYEFVNVALRFFGVI